MICPVASVSRIQEVRCLPVSRVEFVFIAKGVLVTKLVVGLGVEC